MTYQIEQPLALACTFIWVGFVCAISFMESWLKFRAPGVTLPVGLGIGRIVFNVLNKLEWFFAVLVLCSAVWNKTVLSVHSIFFFAAFIIVVLQTFWLLPSLDARAEAVITGQQLETSNDHWYFIVAEILKLAALVISGIYLFKKA